MLQGRGHCDVSAGKKAGRKATRLTHGGSSGAPGLCPEQLPLALADRVKVPLAVPKPLASTNRHGTQDRCPYEACRSSVPQHSVASLPTHRCRRA